MHIAPFVFLFTIVQAKYIGWWDAGDKLTDLPTGTNLLFWEERPSVLQLGLQLNMTVLMNLHHLLFQGKPLQLVEDYENIVSGLNCSAVHGFFLGDELVWNGISWYNVSKIASSVKSACKDGIVFMNEAWMAGSQYLVPES